MGGWFPERREDREAQAGRVDRAVVAEDNCSAKVAEEGLGDRVVPEAAVVECSEGAEDWDGKP